MRRFIQFAIVAIVAAAVGCAHSGTTNTDSKAAKIDVAPAVAKGDTSSDSRTAQAESVAAAEKRIGLPMSVSRIVRRSWP